MSAILGAGAPVVILAALVAFIPLVISAFRVHRLAAFVFNLFAVIFLVIPVVGWLAAMVLWFVALGFSVTGRREDTRPLG